MRFIEKANNWKLRINNKIRLSYLKFLLKDKFKIGINAIITNTSRIDIFNNNGRISIGNSFSMGYNSQIYVWNGSVCVGNNTSVNDNCKIYGNVSIGANCLLASNIFISSGSHNFTIQPALPIKSQDKLSSTDKNIVIEDDCWIGAGAVIMPGVYIGKGAIIGSNAVVTKNVLPYTINGGIPSKEIGKRLDFKKSFTSINSEDVKYLPFFYRGANYKQFDKAYSDGISFNSNTAIFFFSKSENRKLKIEGNLMVKSDLDIYLNEDSYASTKSLGGLFNLNLAMIKNKIDTTKDYYSISSELREMFDIVVLKVSDIPDRSKHLDNLQIISIGLYEN